MLRKFVTIKNVGKFRNCRAVGDIEFRKLSLVYGENSRGKNTLGAVLRSLQLGDANPVLERHTVDSPNPPEPTALSLLLLGSIVSLKRRTRRQAGPPSLKK